MMAEKQKSHTQYCWKIYTSFLRVGENNTYTVKPVYNDHQGREVSH